MPLPSTTVRLSPKTRDYLEAIAKMVSPDRPSLGVAITWLARNGPPPEGLDPLSAAARRAHKEMLKS